MAPFQEAQQQQQQQQVAAVEASCSAVQLGVEAADEVNQDLSNHHKNKLQGH